MYPMDDEDKQPQALGEVLKSLTGTPPTDYSFYKDISSEDRAKLAQNLMQQQHSGGNLVASGLAGLGDAISNSYGGQHTTFQKDVTAGADQNVKDKLAAFDTNRTQRLQDMQGDQEMMMNDPNGAIATSMRATLKAAGVNAPSGMSPTVMLKISGPLGELAMKQAQMMIQRDNASETKRHNAADEAHSNAALSQQGEQSKAAQAEKDSDDRRSAAEGLNKRGLIQKTIELVPPFRSDATKEFDNTLNKKEEKKGGWTYLGAK